MGWVKDNFPGSPAQFQRTRVARGMVAYAFIAGGLIYTFSPYAKQHRQAIKDGLWDDPDWIKEKGVLRGSKLLFGVPRSRAEVEGWLAETERIYNLEGDNPVPKPKAPVVSNPSIVK